MPPVLAERPDVRALEEEEAPGLTKRLTENFEKAWDQILGLHRNYLGETAHAAGMLDVQTALLAMAAVHPANMDLFAHRFLRLLCRSVLQARAAPPRMRTLDIRMRVAHGGVNDVGGDGEGPFPRPPASGKGKSKGKMGGGVVLHRVPKVVRAMFESEPEELFFLDFLTGVDSAKLYSALVPRLSAAMLRAIAAAAGATTNQGFVDAVLDARLYARFLSVTMNVGNWAHSPQSFSGSEDKEQQKRVGLGRCALLWRLEMCSAKWMAVFDVEGVIRSAMRSRQTLAIVAALATADVVVRLACVDPVAKQSDWYRRGLQAIASVRVYSAGCKEMAADDRPAGSMPLVNVIVGELLEYCSSFDTDNDVRFEEAPSEIVCADNADKWRAIGDIRLIRACCLRLDVVRRLLLIPAGLPADNTVTKTAVRRITPRATGGKEVVSSLSRSAAPASESSAMPSDAPSALEEPVPMVVQNSTQDGDREEDSVQAALRKEFYIRMDGRLRELIGVVAASKPDSWEAAIRSYTTIAKTLYPSTAQTVVAVAAKICASQITTHRKAVGKRQGGDSGLGGAEMEGVVHVDRVGEKVGST